MGQIRRLLKIVFTLVTLVTSKKRRQAAALQSALREILTTGFGLLNLSVLSV